MQAVEGALVYAILFDAVAETLKTIGADPRHLGGELGFIAILHTWGQTLTYHPHIHCLVPGGALSTDGQRWIACRPRFFLPIEQPKGAEHRDSAVGTVS